MLSKQDYRLMAGAFRRIHLRNQTTIFQDATDMYLEFLEEFIHMLETDNPKFRQDYFINYIRYGAERPKSPSGEAEA
jgi:hypothetical protein